jgi:outer membrane protein assembly factor BamB
MKDFRKKPYRLLFFQPQKARCPHSAGNVLIYVVVLMLIFGVLGVIMVSLFTSSTASTVTQNDTRRAIYMAESGMRYAFSELRNADFDEDFINNTLNIINYKVNAAGNFDINVFSPWFDSKNDINGVAQIPLRVRLGEIPDGFPVLAGVFLVNYEFVGDRPLATGIASIKDVDGKTLTEITYNLNDPIVANQNERICFAAQPTENWTITDGGNLYVSRGAREIFPRFAGAISIGRNEYFYEESIDDPDNSRVELTGIVVKTPESSLPLNVTTADYVILSPRNYLVVPTGTSHEVTYGGDYLFGRGIYDSSLIQPGTRKPDITADDLTSDLSEQETSTDFFQTDTLEDTLTIGGGGVGQFGSAFYDANLSIGGDPDYCVAGACDFYLGIRAFFLVNFVSQGDGITFTLTSGPPQNSASSAGGDIQLGELMGYAGDSRIDPNGTLFLATSESDRGLDPPKIAVEFDTFTNNRLGDPPPDYCFDASSLKTNSRNDPLTSNKDAVQYVFWGRTSFLNIPCRDNNPLYDDNRHDADGEEPEEMWNFETGLDFSIWRPAIGSDGTIYISDQVSKLYALNQDGTQKWVKNLGDGNVYMPGVDRTGGPNDGTIYTDVQGNALLALNPNGTEKWRLGVASDIDSTPIVGDKPGTPAYGIIFFGTDDANSIFAVRDNGASGAIRWQFVTPGDVNTVPALSPDGSVVYAVSNEIDDSDGGLYAVNVSSNPAIDGTLRWRFPIRAEYGEVNSSPTVNPADGTIYVGSDDQYVYAINPDGTQKWRFNPGTGYDIESTPAVAIDPSDGNYTVYIGSDDSYVYAINASTGGLKWRFDTGDQVISSPVVDLDGTIYVGSDDGRVYAINPNGTPKWNFPTGDQIRSSPALGLTGFIHIGSNDGRLYTISQYADPKNFKDEDKSLGKLLTVEDLSSAGEVVEVNSTDDWLNGKPGVKGPFAVRLEVDRAITANGDGEYDYELRLWMRQCNNDTLCDNILGTFFQDTRVEYDYSAVPATLPMTQRFSLSAAEHAAFEKFFFGFTGGAGSQVLEVTIRNFQLSFIRPGDSVVTDDSFNWPP